MKKVLLGTLLGFGLFLLGVYLGFIAIQIMQEGGPPWLLLGALVIGGFGMFVIYKAGRIDAFKPKADLLKDPAAQPNRAQSILEKNNSIIKDWNVTNEKRDKLKMLEAAGRVEDENSLS